MAGRRRRESVEEVASSRSGGGGGVTISFNQPPPEGRPDASLDGAALALGHGTSPARLLRERAILYTSYGEVFQADGTADRRDAGLPAALRAVPAAGGGTARLYKATYAANDPNEDRHTLVVGEGFLFAGVWDGHGGWGASDFAERSVYQHFKAATQKGFSSEPAFAHAYRSTDIHYLEQSRQRVEDGVRPTDLFAGTCAVSAFIDLEARTICVSNLGDCRVVLGIIEEGGLPRTIPLSWDHSADLEQERLRVREEHPGDHEATVNCGGDYGEPDDWRIKGVCAFTRSLGDFQMKDTAAATLYNTYTKGYKVVPRPGDARPGAANGEGPTKPYIINEPTFAQHDVAGECFVIIACDGVWDEMSSEEAVARVNDVLAHSSLSSTPLCSQRLTLDQHPETTFHCHFLRESACVRSCVACH